MRIRPFDLRSAYGRLFGAVVGVIALHQLAYLVAHPTTVGRAVAADGHDYLTPVASVLLPLAATLGLWAVVCRLASQSKRSVTRARTLDYAALFLLQETLERLVVGDSPISVLTEPAVWVGLSLTPLFALVSRLIARTVERVDVPPSARILLVRPGLLGGLAPEAPQLRVRTLTPTVLRMRGPPALTI